MTNPTTNFGWVMPSPTDLVTDLPADFEVFGQAVDTDFVDLLGGTTGQILSKTSATDLDFTWINNDQGDITAITVTAPITGGGTSGSVGIAISAASTSASGAVQLSDSTSTTSSVLAATPTAVKAAYDKASTAATTSIAGIVQLSDSTSTTSSVLASTPTATKSAYDLANAAIPKSLLTTAGDTLYRNATVPARLGIGTAGQVLKVNSGATAPEWGSDDSITLISSTTMSGSATITLSSIPGTYTNLYLVYTGAFSAGAFDNLQYRLNGDSGTNYDWNFTGSAGGSADLANAIQGTAGQLGSSTNLTNAYDKASGIIQIFNYNQTSVPVVCTSATRTNYGGTVKGSFGNLQYRQAAAITSFSIIASSSFSGGTIKLYGVK